LPGQYFSRPRLEGRSVDRNARQSSGQAAEIDGGLSKPPNVPVVHARESTARWRIR